MFNGVSFFDSNEIQSHFYFTKYQFFIFHKTALHIAVQKKNKKIIKLLISHPNIDINIKDDILSIKNLIKFKYDRFNDFV